MLKIVEENVFDSGAECLVNTINCVGFMGKGLALEFAIRFPKLEERYIEQCKQHKIHTGTLYFYEINGQKIINFPTKFHFKNPSKIEWIEQGLDYFVLNYKKWDIKSIAFPLLGTRNGGLDQNLVLDIMKKKFSGVNVDVFICLNRKPDKLLTELLLKFKNCDIYALCENTGMNKKQTDILVANQKQLKQFSKLLELPSIGSTAYKKIFDYLCNNKSDDSVRLF